MWIIPAILAAGAGLFALWLAARIWFDIFHNNRKR